MLSAPTVVATATSVSTAIDWLRQNSETKWQDNAAENVNLT